VIPRDLLRDIKIRSGCADRGQLIAEIFVQRVKPLRHSHNGFAITIECRNTVVDVLHVWRFDERVIEVLVARIQRMVDLERSSLFGEISKH
jgi:hypothetical protein